ncbi:MAG: DUF4178 domain-containing protein [Gemmatimonadaceae bacterium]
MQQTQTVVCPSCHAVLDSRDQTLSVLQQYQAKMAFEPDLPLGTRGTMRGDPYEVSGFQVRSVRHDAAEYFWREYTLWNPYKGYRYLAEYNGHWCDFEITRIAPSELVTGRQPFVQYADTMFRHFRTTTVTTVFILGEFPWQCRSGDQMTSRDFIAPPRLLSEQVSSNRTVWALGTYLPSSVIWHAFARPGAAPPANGVFAAEPNPYAPLVRKRTRYAVVPMLFVAAAWALRRAITPRSHWLGASWPYALLLAAMAIPATIAAVHASRFERDRWSTSDYAPDEM